MKKILCLFLILICLLTSCAPSIVDIEVYKTTEVNYSMWHIKAYNDYACTGYNIIQNEDGTYTVTFTFDKLKADYRLPGAK